MIVKGARKASFKSMWATSHTFRLLVVSTPFTIAVIASAAALGSWIVIIGAPLILIWKTCLLFAYTRRRKALIQLDPLHTMDHAIDLDSRFGFLRRWWNYSITVIWMGFYVLCLLINVFLVPVFFFLLADFASLIAFLVITAVFHRRANVAARLRAKGIERGEISGDDTHSLASIETQTPPPTYSSGPRQSTQVVCAVCATCMPHADKVIVQPALA